MNTQNHYLRHRARQYEQALQAGANAPQARAHADELRDHIQKTGDDRVAALVAFAASVPSARAIHPGVYHDRPVGPDEHMDCGVNGQIT